MHGSQKHMRAFLFLFLAAGLAPAQHVSAGFKLGVPLTKASRHGFVDTGRWTVGPTIELALPQRFAIELDALYRGYRVHDTFVQPEIVIEGATYPAAYGVYELETKAWDFPLLLKYRFGAGSMRPFLSAGYTFTHASIDVRSHYVCLSREDVCSASTRQYLVPPTRNTTFSETKGRPTAGAGVEFVHGKLKFAPEVRYTYSSRPTLHQVSVLAGFTF